ncbi:MAG: T9SS type A sorting domain-containing protein [Bacteroidia bacterium]
MKKNRIFLLVFLFFALLQNVQAKHIYASYFSYEYLGASDYKVKLTLLRDCGVGTVFDDQITFSLYNTQTGAFIGNLGASFPVVTNFGTICNGTGFCLEEAVYTTTLSINQKTTITYGRCCRNNNLINILNPGDMGLGQSLIISAPLQNNMPQRQALPPNCISGFQPQVINLAATDIDGDSLAYKMITPRTGGSPDTPIVMPMQNLPFDEVFFVNGSSANNPFGTVGTCSLDEMTGQMLLQVTQIGRYAWGYVIEEWRNGAKIGEYFYDGTLAVFMTSSDISAPFAENNPLTISFPAEKQLHVSLETATHLGTVQLFDLTGKRWYSSEPLFENAHLIDVSTLPQGLYVLRFQNGKEMGSKKFWLP